ncbi:535_t:CDS:2, partial [Scutellospora calospora]
MHLATLIVIIITISSIVFAIPIPPHTSDEFSSDYKKHGEAPASGSKKVPASPIR